MSGKRCKRLKAEFVAQYGLAPKGAVMEVVRKSGRKRSIVIATSKDRDGERLTKTVDVSAVFTRIVNVTSKSEWRQLKHSHAEEHSNTSADATWTRALMGNRPLSARQNPNGRNPHAEARRG